MEIFNIRRWCEDWAKWAVLHDDQALGYPKVSLIADKYKFQTEGIPKLNPLGERVLTAKGKQTRTYVPPQEPDNKSAELLDKGITQMGLYRPDLQIIIGAEYLGIFPKLHMESWRPDMAGVSRWKLIQRAWQEQTGFKLVTFYRGADETTEHWRIRGSKMLGVGRTQYYVLIDQAHTYLACWFDCEVRPVLESAC